MIYLLVAFPSQLFGFSTETSLKVRIIVQKFYSNLVTLYDHRFVTEPAYQKKKKKEKGAGLWSKLTGGQV